MCWPVSQVPGDPRSWYRAYWPVSQEPGEPGGDTERGGQLVRYLVSGDPGG